MVTILLSVALIILIFSINIHLNLYVEYDVLNNDGYFKVKVFNIFLLSGSLSIQENFLQIRKKNNKLININLKITKKQLRFIKELQKNISTKIYIEKFDLSALLCLENPALISILSGIYSIFSNLMFISLKQKNYDICIGNKVDTGFRQNNLKFDMDLSVYMSIFDLMWALLITIIVNRRIDNEERRRKTEC